MPISFLRPAPGVLLRALQSPRLEPAPAFPTPVFRAVEKTKIRASMQAANGQSRQESRNDPPRSPPEIRRLHPRQSPRREAIRALTPRAARNARLGTIDASPRECDPNRI